VCGGGEDKVEIECLDGFETIFAGDCLREFVWGFDFSLMHSCALSTETDAGLGFNILKNTTFTQNAESNKKIGLELIWQIASAVEHKSTPAPFFFASPEFFERIFATF
jgi:hypothetical protein